MCSRSGELAHLSQDESEKLTKLEKELSSKSGCEVVLIAYETKHGQPV